MLAAVLLFSGVAFGYLCAAAGFLIIVASVAFVIKGKLVLGEPGAANTLGAPKIKMSLTSSVALFVVGAAMIALPFWRISEEESRRPATAMLTGQIAVAGNRDLRLLLVIKPDYDQTYGRNINWPVPLLAGKTSYEVVYVDGSSIVNEQSFTVEDTVPGSSTQQVTLPAFDLQVPPNSIAQEVTPKLEVSDATLKNLGIH